MISRSCSGVCGSRYSWHPQLRSAGRRSGCSVLACSTFAELSFFNSRMASLKFLIALPNVLPSSGKRRGPRTRRITPIMRRCSARNSKHPQSIPRRKGCVNCSRKPRFLGLLLGSSGCDSGHSHTDEIQPSGATTSWQMITGDDSEDDRKQWDSHL